MRSFSLRMFLTVCALCNFVQGKRGLSLDSLDKLAECLALRIVAEGEAPHKRTSYKGR